MAKEEYEKSANDYDKAELVYAVSLMLNMHDMSDQVNKLSKPALWRIFDDMQARGNAFANMEDKLREQERQLNEMTTRAVVAEKKVKVMEGKRRGNRSKSRK